mmetsp:Transcript_94988/g.306677  ORF Transcript_94988/g.306677 Transcript_94988/m.306677 type:complete len:609 (-) Transcript_94988:46-1872(-)
MPSSEERAPTYGSLAAPSYGSKLDDYPRLGMLDETKLVALVSLLVCGMALCEQLATETFDGTQIFFIDNLRMDTRLNDGMKFARDRVYMIFLLLCAKLGDNGLGRFWTIMLGAVIYFMGTVMVSLATHPWISRIVWYLLGAFLVLPFSQAAISANIINFGADQFDLSEDIGRQMQERFFWWLNAAVHIGTGLSYALLACYGISQGVSHYLTNDDWVVPNGTANPQEYWTVFIAAAASFSVAISFFAWGAGLYSRKSLETLPSSSIVGLTQYLVKVSSHCSFQGAALLAAKVIGMTIYISQAVLFWSPEFATPLSFASAVGVVFSIGGIILFCQNVEWLNGMERPENQPLSLEDVKDFLRLLPLIVCSQISYGCLFMMMKTWYVRQACQMDLRFRRTEVVHNSDPQMFIGFFDLYYCGTVIAGTPLVLYYVNPRISRWFERLGWRFHHWSKFVMGLAFGVASGLAAAHCEVCRRAAPVLELTSNCAPDGVSVRAMSAYWMLVPYVLMGISTLYVVPALTAISYRQVPKTVRSLTVVTNIFMMSASQSVVMAVSVSMKEYTPHNLDTGNLEYLYFAILAISFLVFLIFANMVPYYEEKNYDDIMSPVPAA